MNTDYTAFLAKRLASLRHKKGVSARAMSLDLGQNPTYIAQIETGNALPSLRVFFAICDYLEITPQTFFDETALTTGVLSSTINDLKRLDDQELSIVRSIVRKIKEIHKLK